jgi:hypothetical protein
MSTRRRTRRQRRAESPRAARPTGRAPNVRDRPAFFADAIQDGYFGYCGTDRLTPHVPLDPP